MPGNKLAPRHAQKSAIVAKVIRKDSTLRPFINIREATLEAFELAMRATDNPDKRRAWRRIYRQMTGKDYYL